MSSLGSNQNVDKYILTFQGNYSESMYLAWLSFNPLFALSC